MRPLNPLASRRQISADPRRLPDKPLPFHARPEAELTRLSDEDLIAYLRAAHAAGATDAARTALQLLVFGYWTHVSFRLGRKLPAHTVEDVTGDVIVRAIQSAFSGHSVGEFRSWLNTITDRAVADLYRTRSRRPEEAPLERDEDEGRSIEPAAPDGRGHVEVQAVIEDLLAEMRPDHRRVTELVVFEDRPASAVAGDVEGMSTDNVYQVVSRFRRRLRELLELDTGTRDG